MDPRSRNGIIQFEIGIINIVHKLQETFVTAKSKIVDFQNKLIQVALSNLSRMAQAVTLSSLVVQCLLLL